MSKTMARALLFALACLAVALLAAPAATADGGSGGGTIQVSIPPTGTVVCTARSGAALPVNPALHRGDTVLCAVSRLRAAERVAVTVAPDGRDLGTVSTDAQGRLRYRFTVPGALALGAHRLTFTGRTSKATAVFAFHVVTGRAGGPGHGSGPGHGPGGLPFTGAHLLGPLLAAGVLIGGGSVLTMANRRRRRHG